MADDKIKVSDHLNLFFCLIFIYLFWLIPVDGVNERGKGKRVKKCVGLLYSCTPSRDTPCQSPRRRIYGPSTYPRDSTGSLHKTGESRRWLFMSISSSLLFLRSSWRPSSGLQVFVHKFWVGCVNLFCRLYLRSRSCNCLCIDSVIMEKYYYVQLYDCFVFVKTFLRCSVSTSKLSFSVLVNQKFTFRKCRWTQVL